MSLPRPLVPVDIRLTRWMARHGVHLLRVSLGVVFFWFGVLKFFPELSPAQDLAARTMERLTLGMVGPTVSLPLLAAWECLIGLGLITGVWMRAVLLLLVVQMLGTLTPVVLFPTEVFARVPYAPTLEGQYIIKNFVLISGAIVIGATVRGGSLIADPVPRPGATRGLGDRGATHPHRFLEEPPAESAGGSLSERPAPGEPISRHPDPLGSMDTAAVADRLERNAEVFTALLSGIPLEQARWRPDPAHWSLLEVINHLADEEAEDFRRRLRLTLQDPGEEWPPIDPEEWARERRYNERDPAESLRRFLEERAESVRWLRSIQRIHPAVVHRHPVHGAIRAIDLAASWLAHDLIHIRQMTRLRYEHLADRAGHSALAYAGRW